MQTAKLYAVALAVLIGCGAVCFFGVGWWVLGSLLCCGVFVLLAFALSGPVTCPRCDAEALHLGGNVWRCRACLHDFGGPDYGE
jgi:hypothetical protein